ncbi:MAG: C_GCAxxG_C_C family protein [Bacteroidales bacterium]|jgi:C_GCAxxG_C_C family probable redox protein|nr:C_GCAxxG_C_C family protein [Bacteroidales bacterium]
MEMKVNVEERSERARELFKNGYSCSQAVLVAYADVFNIDASFAAQLASPFGGGIARMREVCGCVCAMALAGGFIEPSFDPKDIIQVQKTRDLVRKLADEFGKEHGDIICRNLLQNKEKHSCVDYVAFSAKLIGEEINNKN